MTVKLMTQAERRARRALEGFCLDMQDRNPYIGIDWNANTWIVGRGRRASARNIERLHFTRHKYACDADGALGTGFSEPFASFVKGTIVWRAINAKKRPTPLSQMGLVRAFRYLYEELAKSELVRGAAVSPTSLKPYHLSAAATAVVARESDQASYRVANYLKYIADLIDRKALTALPLSWAHEIPRPDTSGGLGHYRIGEDFHNRRKQRLLSDDVMYAVAEISNSAALEPPDAVRQRLTDILCSGGFRLNECLVLLRDAKVEEEVRDDLGQVAKDANGEPLPPYFGLRFNPEKEGEHGARVKWIPTEFVPIARRAFDELLELTAEFAKDAEFAYLNPGRVRLGEPWDSMPSETLLTTSQLSEMVGLAGKSSARHWVDRYIGERPKGQASVCTKGAAESAIRERMGSLEVMIEGSAVPLHKILAVVPINYFHSRKASIRGSATWVTDQNVSDYLGGRVSKKGSAKSIFERLNVRNELGEIVRINSHQFRHFLDTVASIGGVPELVRARWMGRKDISQNSAYDHESGISLAKKIRARLVDGRAVGPIADAAKTISDPVAREGLAESLIRAVHKTTLGRCFHDWASSPCPENEACWSCDEHLVIKGEAAAVAEASRQLDETLSAISSAQAELVDETYGVNNWLSSYLRKRVQLERILSIHNDPTIPDGTVVHLKKDTSKVTDDSTEILRPADGS